MGLLASPYLLSYEFSWHVTLSPFVASTMRTCSLTMCTLALAPVCSGVPLVWVGLRPSLQLTSTISVSPPPWPLSSQRLRLGLRVRQEEDSAQVEPDLGLVWRRGEGAQL